MDKQLLYQQLFQAKGNCLTEEELLNYVQNSLSEKEQHHVEKHLLSCELCNEAVEGLLLIQKERQNSLINSTKKAIAKRVHKVNYWAWAAIFSGIFLSSFAVLYFNNQLSKNYATESMSYDMSSNMRTEKTETVENDIDVENIEEEETPLIIMDEVKKEKQQHSFKNEIVQAKDKSISAPPSTPSEVQTMEEPNELLYEDKEMINDEIFEDNSSLKKSEQKIQNNDPYLTKDVNQKRSVKHKIAEKKSISLGMNISDEMNNIAFSKIPKDSSKAFKLFTAQNYQMASILYQDKLKKEPKNEWLIYTNSLLYFLLKEEDKATTLLKEIENSDKEQWLSACIYIKNEDTKKAKKLLKKLTKKESLFTQNAQNILQKIE